MKIAAALIHHRKRALMLGLLLLSACAGTGTQVERQEEMVQVPNPAFTMSPDAPETIWVPRSYVQKGIPRGKELAKKSYQSLAGAEPSAPATPPDTAPAAPLAPPAPAEIVDTSGKPAQLVPVYGLVLALQGERVYFNLGAQDGMALGVKLRIYRGGTIVRGLGLAPGEPVATVEVSGLVGNRGAFGVVKQGGPVQVNDLAVRE